MTTNDEINHIAQHLSDFDAQHSEAGTVIPAEYYREEAGKFIMLADALAAYRAQSAITGTVES